MLHPNIGRKHFEQQLSVILKNLITTSKLSKNDNLVTVTSMFTLSNILIYVSSALNEESENEWIFNTVRELCSLSYNQEPNKNDLLPLASLEVISTILQSCSSMY